MFEREIWGQLAAARSWGRHSLRAHRVTRVGAFSGRPNSSRGLVDEGLGRLKVGPGFGWESR